MSKDVVATLVLPDDRDAAGSQVPPARRARERRVLGGLGLVAVLLAAAALLRPGAAGPDTPGPDFTAPDEASLRGRPAVALIGENVELGPAGSFDVDLVNRGNRSLLVVGRLGALAGRVRIMGDPQLPIDLAPDQRRRVRLIIVLPSCPGPGPAAIADQLGLEGRSDVGWAFAQGTPGSELGRAFSAAATAADQAQCGGTP
jgi:hypothetical protein